MMMHENFMDSREVVRNFAEEFHNAFINRSNSTSEIFKNPSRQELHDSSYKDKLDGRLTGHKEVGLWLHGKDMYSFNRMGVLHAEAKHHIDFKDSGDHPLSLYVYHHGKEASAVVTDASRNTSWHHNPETRDYVLNHPQLKKHFKNKVNPDGSLGDFKKFTEGKKKGQNKIATWKATSGIVNAVKSMHAYGDADKISAAMGGRHKVRSFYNNILDPNSENRDVTVDTHAIGASWLSPHTASHVSLVHGLGLPINKKKLPAGAMTTKNSASTGISGAYPIYADAYREAAEHLSKQHNIDLHPRQLQSVAWEAKRGMFGEITTGTKVKAAVNEAWEKHHNGELSHEEAQHAVVHAAMKSLGRKTSGRKVSGESLEFIRDLVEVSAAV
jgi:hypothetical protein